MTKPKHNGINHRPGVYFIETDVGLLKSNVLQLKKIVTSNVIKRMA